MRAMDPDVLDHFALERGIRFGIGDGGDADRDLFDVAPIPRLGLQEKADSPALARHRGLVQGGFNVILHRLATLPDHVFLPAAERRALGVLARRADAVADDAGRATRRPAA